MERWRIFNRLQVVWSRRKIIKLAESIIMNDITRFEEIGFYFIPELEDKQKGEIWENYEI